MSIALPTSEGFETLGDGAQRTLVPSPGHWIKVPANTFSRYFGINPLYSENGKVGVVAFEVLDQGIESAELKLADVRDSTCFRKKRLDRRTPFFKR